VAVRYWPGGTHTLDDALLARSDVVEVSGGDEAVAAVRARARGRFVGRGARLSFAALGREVLAEPASLAAAMRGIAEDVSIWDQRGCLSPQVVFAETSTEGELSAAAEALAVALAELARRWPPRRRSLEERAAVLRFRQAVEWGLGATAAGRVIAGDDLGWMIAVEKTPALRPTCLQRSVRLQPVARLEQIPALAAPVQRWLEAAGLAVEEARFAALARRLEEHGVHRACRAGEMQRPDLSWKPGGLPRLRLWMQG
jgi:hypothetical protein